VNAVTHPSPARTRERLLIAAAELTCAEGWASVTMGKLAAHVGVSRQTVYNELGSKADLAEALMLRETDLFAQGVADVIAANPGRPVEGVTAAFRYTLEAARDNPLLKTVLGGPYGGRDDLLPLITTQPEAVLDRAVAAVAPMLSHSYPEAALSASEWVVAVEAFVRLLLSHLVQPSGSIDHAAGQMRWVVARMLGG
jgi:AcrR family transcriptional regulator